MTVLELLSLMVESPHTCFMFLLLQGRNVWAVLRTGYKYTKRKGYGSTEELNRVLSLTYNFIGKKKSIHPLVFASATHTHTQRVRLRDPDIVRNRAIGMGG